MIQTKQSFGAALIISPTVQNRTKIQSEKETGQL